MSPDPVRTPLGRLVTRLSRAMRRHRGGPNLQTKRRPTRGSQSLLGHVLDLGVESSGPHAFGPSGSLLSFCGWAGGRSRSVGRVSASQVSRARRCPSRVRSQLKLAHFDAVASRHCLARNVGRRRAAIAATTIVDLTSESVSNCSLPLLRQPLWRSTATSHAPRSRRTCLRRSPR